MINRLRNFFNSSDKRGVTLVEILVVASLIALISTQVIRNFSASRLNLERIANVMAADIRTAQQMSISSHQYQHICVTEDGPSCISDPVPRNRCGYGVTLNPDSLCNGYIIYAGPPTLDAFGNPKNCGSKQYQSKQDTPAYKAVILDSRLNLDDPNGSGVCTGNPPAGIFKDIFFQPPGPTTFFKNSSTSSSFDEIVIKKVGKKLTGPASGRCGNNDPDCIRICVYLSGRVEVTRSSTCPSPF